VKAVAVAQRAAEADELWVEAGCAGWLVAMSARHVERLILPEDALLAPELFPGPPGSLGMLSVRDRTYSAWDLGVLLGLVSQEQAYVLVQLAGIPIALRTGPCIGITRLPAASLHRLPSRLATARRGAFLGVFPAQAGRQRGNFAPIGIALDLERLLTSEERLHADAACLAASMVRMEEQEVRP